MIKNLLQEGFALKSNGHYKHAIEVFYKALEEDNSSSELLLEIANLYYLMHNEERALSYIEQILNKEPSHINSLKLLKKIFIDKGALAEAEQTAKNIYCISHNNDDLTEILKLYNVLTPDCAIYIEQAFASFNKHDYENAENLSKKALEINADSQEALLLLGKVFYAQNKKDACIPLLAKFIPNNKNPELLNFVGLINTYLGKHKEAIENFLEAIKLNRANAVYYYNLANVYFKQGDFASAKKYYNLSISFAPENANYHFALANLYYTEGHYKKALEELDENLFEARLLKAVILYDTGYLALAKKELDLLSNEHSNNNIIREYQTLINKELGLI